MAFNFQGNPALAMGMGGGGLMGGGLMGLMGGEGHHINPGLNDAPLEFNTTKMAVPPSADIDERNISSSSASPGVVLHPPLYPATDERRHNPLRRNNKDRNKDPKEVDKSVDVEGILVDEVGSSGGEPTLTPLWPAPPSIIPPTMYQMMSMNGGGGGGGMLGMEHMMMGAGFGMMVGAGGGGGTEGAPGGVGVLPELLIKEVIQLKSVTLVPPAPATPPPHTRERPPGCKTIFVGGLAENTTEEIIREIFSRCGEMLTVRLSNKKFCHIRFLHEASVDAALYFSGYRMRIENKTDAANTGRLHVDFAQARDDQYEWECRQRQLQREARHRDRVEKERLRVPSPPPVPHYTEHEASAISDRIKSEETFGKAVQVVITWLERGDCSKRNSSAFYSMIQSTNSHIRRLLSEKASHEEELQKAKDLMKARMQSLLIQYAQIERVFVAASHKKVWDHFTKAQRKNIEMWKKQAAEIKAIELEEHLNTGAEDEMDVSDEDDPIKKKPRIDDKLNQVKEENDSLRCQLEAYKNEVEVVRHELRAELEATQAKLKLTQHTLHQVQQQLYEARSKQSEEELKVAQLKAQLQVSSTSSEGRESGGGGGNGGGGGGGEAEGGGGESSSAASTPTPPVAVSRIDENDAKLIGLISMFLNVHPFGAGVDYVWSYVQKLEPQIRPADIEALLTRFPSLFQQELSGIGANMERRWVITALKQN